MNESGRLGFLDGLRGLASVWVVLGHTCILTQFNIPIIASPHYAVDLFMIISGLLMYFQAELRSAEEPFSRPQSWVYFWTRRYFRLSPVYYVALAIALAFGSRFGDCRDFIASVFPDTATTTARYSDGSLANILAHITYIFGLVPYYSFRTPVPDWSIGLEMQFYAVFPLIYLAMCRIGRLTVAILTIALSALPWLLLPTSLRSFEMPSFLLLKINLFLAGMLLSAGMNRGRSSLVYFAAAIILAMLPMDGDPSIKGAMMRGAIAIVVVLLLIQENKFLGNRFFYWLGELSYSAYLTHLLALLPIAAHVDGIGLQHASTRFLISSVATMAVVYPVSWLILKLIEAPGRGWGKRMNVWMKSRKSFRTA
ncbi:peptidoglycan/LPS O-acetylase OafA/YrhL [Bradyrhizobium sp. USDA 4463]